MNNAIDAAFVYNVTTQVAHPIKESWIQWMKEIHIPQVLETGCFTHFQFVQILELDETDGLTYTVQYYTPSKALYNKYVDQFAAALRNDALQKWGNQIASFRSLMQCI